MATYWVKWGWSLAKPNNIPHCNADIDLTSFDVSVMFSPRNHHSLEFCHMVVALLGAGLLMVQLVWKQIAYLTGIGLQDVDPLS